MDDKVNLAEKIELLDEPYRPGIVDRDVELGEGDMFVVPRGVEHCPRADEETHVLLIEPKGTLNTGDAGGDRTAEEIQI